MTASSSASSGPFASGDVPWEEWSGEDGRRVRFRRLGAFGGAGRVGVDLVELAPGDASYPAHYHMVEEEQLFVLGGRAELHVGAQVHPLSPGDHACFPAGRRLGHYVRNVGVEPFRYLMIGTHSPDEVVVYTDDRLVAIRALGLRLPSGALNLEEEQ